MRCEDCGHENAVSAAACAVCGSDMGTIDGSALDGDESTLDRPQPQSGVEVLFDRYQVISELGRGGMGKVLKVFDNKVREVMALKLIKPEIAGRAVVVERFRSELKLARRVAHRYVCRMFDFDESDGVPYMTMEFVSGSDLKQILKADGPLGPARVVELALQVAAGLSEAHRLDVIHRDLKPQNIMVDTAGEARIMDFGLARTGDAPHLTSAASVVGTPFYMSPEQVDGLDLDIRTDIYSFGIVLFELLIGKPPYGGKTAVAVGLKHKTEPVPDASQLKDDVPPALAAVVRKCMAKDRNERFQTIDDVARALGAVDAAGIVASPEAGAAVAPDVTAGAASSISLELSASRPPILDREESDETQRIFAGREKELARLEAGLQDMLAGRGRTLFITGEPGSGKTELAAEFIRRAHAAQPEFIALGGRANANTGVGNPYHPFREVLTLATGDIKSAWAGGPISREHAERLWRFVPSVAQSLVASAPRLIDAFVPAKPFLQRVATAAGEAPWLAGVREAVEGVLAGPVAPLQEAEIQEQYSQLLQTLARETPLVLLLDDLHWADAGSIALIFQLSRQLAGERLLILGTYRPEDLEIGRDGERHPLEQVVNEIGREQGDIQIPIDLSRGRQFMEEYLDARPNRFGKRFRDALYRQTRGQALFTIELLRSLIERGMIREDEEGRWFAAPDLDFDTLPSRAEAVIGERFARLRGDLKELLRLASVEGTQFTAEVLAELRGEEERAVVRMLSGELHKRQRLIEPDGIRRVGRRRLSLYSFRHALFQKFLYSELDEAELGYLHEDVGTALERLYGDDAGEVAVQLARHFRLAADPEREFTYSKLAGRRALHLGAYKEGLLHLQRGVELLDDMPASSEARQQELELLLDYITALIATQGYTTDEVRRICDRARQICGSPGEIPEGVPLLYRMWGVHFVRSDREAAPDLAAQMLELAERGSDPEQKAVAEAARGVSLFFAGSHEEAAPALAAAAECYTESEHMERSFKYMIGDPLFTARAYGTWNLMLQGQPDRAMARQNEGLTIAERIEDSFTIALALAFSTTLERELRLPPATVGATALRMTELADEHGLVWWSIIGGLFHAWSEGMQGDASAIERTQELLAVREAMGAWTTFPTLLVMLAQIQSSAGDRDAALASIDRALEMSAANLDSFYDPEAWRVRGDILTPDDPTAAEAAYRRSLKLAMTNGARLYELYAAAGLASLLVEQGRGGEVSALLRPRYEAVTGGRDLPAMREAASLLDDAS